MSLTESLKTKIKSCLPEIYKLDWKGKEYEPVRFRTSVESSDIVILNTIWTKILEKVTQCKHVIYEKYIRINTEYSGDTTAISIYPTGTIMFQGGNYVTWLDEYIETICIEMEAEIENQENKLQSSDESLSLSSLKSPSPNNLSLKPPISSTPKISSFHLSTCQIEERSNTSKSPEIISPTKAYLSNIQSTLNTINENDSGNSEGVIGEMKSLSKEVANSIKETLTQKNWESVRTVGYHHDTYNQSGILSGLDLSVPAHYPGLHQFKASIPSNSLKESDELPEKSYLSNSTPPNNTSSYKLEDINHEISALNCEKRELENELEVIKRKLKMNEEIVEKVSEMKEVKVINHRLMHRDSKSVIKEYVILEGKYSMLKKQVNDLLQEKLTLKNQLVKLNKDAAAPKKGKSVSLQEEKTNNLILSAMKQKEKILEEVNEKLNSQLQQKDEKLGYVQNILRLANNKMEADKLYVEKLEEELIKQQTLITNLQEQLKENNLEDDWESIESDASSLDSLPCKNNIDNKNFDNRKYLQKCLSQQNRNEAEIQVHRKEIITLNNENNSNQECVINMPNDEIIHQVITENPLIPEQKSPEDHEISIPSMIDDKHQCKGAKENTEKLNKQCIINIPSDEIMIDGITILNPQSPVPISIRQSNVKQVNEKGNQHQNNKHQLTNNSFKRTDRPICKLFLNNRCYSLNCIYNHPNKTSNEYIIAKNRLQKAVTERIPRSSFNTSEPPQCYTSTNNCPNTISIGADRNSKLMSDTSKPHSSSSASNKLSNISISLNEQETWSTTSKPHLAIENNAYHPSHSQNIYNPYNKELELAESSTQIKSRNSENKESVICKYYLRNNCKLGYFCRFKHSKPKTTQTLYSSKYIRPLINSRTEESNILPNSSNIIVPEESETASTPYTSSYRKYVNPDDKPICKFYLRNNCRLGNSCRFPHSRPLNASV